MKKRTDHLIKAWTCLLIVMAFPILVILDEIPDPDMYIIGGVACVICALLSTHHFWEARKTPAQERMEAPPEPDAQVDVQFGYYRRALLISSIMVPASAALIMWFMDPSMENARKRTLYWAPFQYINDQFGYWPAALVLPTFFAIASLLFLWKIRKVRKIVEVTYR